MAYVIGIDGGGTKTEAILADDKGTVAARALGGASNPNLLQKEEVYQVFNNLLQALESQAPAEYKQTTNLFAGISGVGNKQSNLQVTDVLQELVPGNVKVKVESDTVNALFSGTYGNSGIVQIAGTGSVTYGVNENAETGRVGGWGYLFGDEGSGYDIGRQGIAAALKAKDGRGGKTIMTEMFFNHFSIDDELELIQKIYNSNVPKNEISPLSKIVLGAYKKNDRQAVEIVQKAVGEMHFSIVTLYKRIFEPQKNVEVILCGGIFNDIEVIPALLGKKFEHMPELSISLPEMRPVGGSVIGAYSMNGIHPPLSTIQNLIHSLKEGEA